MRSAYMRIFDRMGLTYRMVQADSGAIGGSTSAEFQVLVDSGEDAIVACDSCDYAANVEVATVSVDRRRSDAAPAVDEPIARVHTPGHGTIDEVAKFLAVGPERRCSSRCSTSPVARWSMVVVRGDHEVNEVRLARALGVDEVFLASEADVRKATGAEVGFAGPVGFTGKILVDRAASVVPSGVTGANETDWHLKNVRFGRDFAGEVVDVRLATNGDPCPSCDGGKLTSYRGIEAGHIFILGTQVLGDDGRHVHRRKAAAAHARHGLLRHRRLAPRRDGHRATPRRQRHSLADEHRALPSAPRHARAATPT